MTMGLRHRAGGPHSTHAFLLRRFLPRRAPQRTWTPSAALWRAKVLARWAWCSVWGQLRASDGKIARQDPPLPR
eukprot:144111-Chlamydomonas_euryale.AAC.1